MKKVLFVLVMALMSITVTAQENPSYDEESLLGAWVANGDIMEVGGGSYGPVAVGCLSLNANRDSYISWTNPYTGYYSSLSYTTYFVSNGDKLHLVSQMPTQLSSLTFVITLLEYNEDTGFGTMCLRPLGEKNRDYWFVRQGSPNNVSSSSLDSRTSEEMYDLSGKKTDYPIGPYIQNGKKYIAK